MLNLKIISPTGIVYDGVITKITLSTDGGYITILHDHEPLISLIKASMVVFDKAEEEGVQEDNSLVRYVTSKGIVKVNKNVVTLLVDYAQFVSETDEQVTIDSMLEKARNLEKRLADKDEVLFAKAEKGILRGV